MNSIDSIQSFSDIRRLHFTGLKGIAMTAFAVWATERGITVSGSDIDEEFPSDQILNSIGIRPYIGFKPSHVVSNGIRPDALIFTGAHNGRENEEVRSALSLGIPVLPHGKALGIAMRGYRQISVAGSHGKTTTSSMIACIFHHAGLDPSWAIGCGQISGLGNPGHYGQGTFFIAEADEYVTDPKHDTTPRFLWQTPEILVVTNIDYDHPDVYDSLDDVRSVFVRLKSQQTQGGICIVNSDDPVSDVLRSHTDAVSVTTFGSEGDVRFSHVRTHGHTTEFRVNQHSSDLGIFSLHVPGIHNVRNAVASIIAAQHAGIPLETIRAGLSKFRGAKRRFEHITEKNGISFYDDYAHHPKEIDATIRSAREWFPGRRIIAVFQPHTYSRTLKLLDEFTRAFSHADCVLISDIYASAREKAVDGVSGKVLSDGIAANGIPANFEPGWKDIAVRLRNDAKRGDVVLFMGAGNIYSWEKKVIEEFE